MKNTKYTTKSETNRVFSVFESFNQDAEKIKSSLANDPEYPSIEPVLTMSSLGQLGRFGNQLFQYAFLKICAQKSGAKVECPPWIGQALFGHNDAPISKRLPPAIECRDVGESLFDVIPEFIPYLEKLADAKSCRVNMQALEHGLVNIDLWGFFQVHTSLLKPYQEYFRSLFQPVSDLKSSLEDALNLLRCKGKTIVGIHIRRGDFMTVPLAGFTLVIPSKWWRDWLDKIWSELEEPVLFLCSDDLDTIIHDFDKFAPVTSRDLNVKLPERMKDLNVEFYIDFFLLSNCDIVGISNSIFSFTACMLNDRGKMFIRPHWDFSTKFTVFDPWNSEPLLWLSGQEPKFFKNLAEVSYITYITQGVWAMLKCIFIYVPKSYVQGWGLRAYLGYKIQGAVGVIKSFLSILGWHSVWKQL